MGKNLQPKCKQCRRIGEKLLLKGERCNTAKCAMIKRNYPPGMHGPKLGRKKLSGYGLQLIEKQKAKKQYNILEKQFRITFERARKQTGDTGLNLLKLLEMRLDNFVYRLGLASSRSQARQLVGHGHFLVNGKRVNIPSFVVKQGDVVAIKKNISDSKLFRELIDRAKKNKNSVPSWINFDVDNKEAKVLHEPKTDDIRANINTQMIVEYYSR